MEATGSHTRQVVDELWEFLDVLMAFVQPDRGEYILDPQDAVDGLSAVSDAIKVLEAREAR